MGERRGIYRVFSGEPRERDNLEDPGINRLDYNNMMKLQEMETQTRSIWLRIRDRWRAVVSAMNLGFIKCG
jgi:hypothetical protein